MNKTVSYNEVSVLPWLSFEEIKVGNIIFWKFKSDLIEDPSIKSYLDEYVKCYVDIHGNSVSSLVLASYGQKGNFEVLKPLESLEMRAARDILCFSSIAPHTLIAVNQDNRTIAPPSSERFQMFSQNFIPGNDGIAFKSGSHSVVTSGGWKLHEIKLSQPLNLGGSLFSTDCKILQPLSLLLTCMSEPEKHPLEIRLLRAIEWFYLAHTEDDSVSIFSKLVMMSTAFEILFAIPNIPNKSDYLACEIDKIFNSSKIGRSRRKMKKQDIEHTTAGWWGWDFYKMRNQVVHGDQVDTNELTYKDWITYLIVADLVFLKTIVKHLYDLGFYLSDIKDIYKDSDDKDGEIEMIDFLTNFSQLYERLGWKK